VNQNPSQNTVRKAWRAALLVSLLISVTQIQAQTQAAMNAQARAEFVKVDAELNRTYEALLAKLPDAESKEKVKQSQRAWVAFRDAEATFAGDQARGGSMPIQQLSTPTRCDREAVRASRRRVSFSLKSLTTPATGGSSRPIRCPRKRLTIWRRSICFFGIES